MSDTPLLITALSIWIYWFSVLVMGFRRRMSSTKATGLAPSNPRERIMWMLWVPAIVAWNALPAFAGKDEWLLQLPPWASENDIALVIRWIAAGVAVVCYLLSVVCWIVMGRNWSVAVVENDQQLVTAGPFRFVRHPIYAISVLLIICTVIALPTIPMAVVALLHITLLNIKARGEERHLLEKYGEQYRSYMQTAGRFVPRFGTHSKK